jgi:hypothetical protein
MTHLRIESLNGTIKIITESGEPIPADVVNIKLQYGAPTEIRVQSRKGENRFRTANTFIANVR